MHLPVDIKLAHFQRQLKRANEWAFQAESDAEYQFARQEIFWIELLIREHQQKAAA